MLQTRREHLASLLGLTVTSCVNFRGVSMVQRERDVELYKILADEFHSLMGSNPLGLLEREDFSRANELPDISKEETERHANKLVALADKIKHSGYQGSNFDERLDLELADNWLRVTALEETALVGNTPKYAVHPRALVDLLSLTPVLLERDPREKGRVVDDFISRSKQMRKYLEQGIARLDRPVSVWVKREMASGGDFKGVVDGVRRFATSVGYTNMVILEQALGEAQEAVTWYLGRLESMLQRTDLSVGHETTQRIFTLKGIDLPLGKLHRLAIEYLRGSTEGLERLRPELVRKYSLDPNLDLIGVGNALKERFASPQGGVVDLANKLLRQSEAFAYERGLVRRIDNEKSDVRKTPDYLKPIFPTAGMIPPGLFVQGERRSTFYASEFPGVERALNRLNLPAITAHELFPGHHYQLTRATEHKSRIRAWVQPTDLAEGWAVYAAEQVMAGEMGYVGDPSLAMEESFMARTDQRRLGGRVCFVLALMTGDIRYLENDLGIKVTSPDLLDASTQFYMGATGFVEPRARGDVELFSSLGTYGALYLVGSNIIRDMQHQGERKHGSSFSRPEFLEALMQEGMVPLSYARRSLEHKGVI